MNTNQQNQSNNTQQGNAQGGMMGNLNSMLGGALGGVRNGSTQVVNTIGNMSTGKKLLALAALSIGARMLQKRLSR